MPYLPNTQTLQQLIKSLPETPEALTPGQWTALRKALNQQTGDSDPDRVPAAGQNKTDLSRLLEQSRRQTALLEAILEANPGAIAVVVGPNLEFAFANAAYRNFCSRSEKDPVGQPYETIWSREDPNCYSAPIRAVVETGQPYKAIDFERRLPDGAIRFFTLQAVRIDWGSQPAALLALWDTTEQVRIEKTHHESEERFRTVADFTSDWEYWIGPDNQLIYCSPACERITGRCPQAFVDDPGLLFEIIHPEDRQQYQDHWANLHKYPDPNSLEFRILTPDGQERWIGHVCQQVFSRDGRPQGRRVSNRDITEHKRSEEALRLSQERLLMTAEAAGVGVWRLDLSSGKLYCDDQVRQILKMPAVPPPETAFYQPLIETEDWDRVEQVTRRMLEVPQRLEVEFRVNRPEGSQRWLYLRGQGQFDPGGQPRQLVGVVMDITERKCAQEDILSGLAQIEVQHRLIDQRENERLIIARDLHDGPVQELTGAHYALEGILYTTEDQDLAEGLRAIRETLRNLAAELRAYAGDLRPPTLVKFGLAKAILSHLDAFQEKHPEIHVQFEETQWEQLLSQDVRLAFFRIYQETLSNIVKHAQATKVSVRLAQTPKQAILEIKENGVGFDIPKDWLELARQGHLGLVGIRERAQAIGGQVEIRSSRGEGSSLKVTAPMKTS